MVLNGYEYETQLQMIWPGDLLDSPPVMRIPFGYSLRTYRPGDEPRFFRLMELAGWPGWNEEVLRPWRARLLVEGWFIVVHRGSAEVVASAMALHSEAYPGGGELGWLAGHPAHAGRGLGMVVSAAVTARLMEGGCRVIHLYTEDYRLAALKTYLKLGYVPFLYAEGMFERWRAVCARLGWAFTPERWEARLPRHLRTVSDAPRTSL